MKRLIIRENSHGRTTEITAKKTYEKGIGNWVAEVDEEEIKRACNLLCSGIENCTCKDLHVEADVDDDGRVYNVVTS